MGCSGLKETVFPKTGSVSVENIDLDCWFEIGPGQLLNCSCSRIAVEGLSGSGDNVDLFESQSEVIISDAPGVLGVAELGNLVLVADSIACKPLPVSFKPDADKDIPPLVSRVIVGNSGGDESASHLDLWAGTSEILE